ncbi:MAG TPA: glucose-6-phosphate isomerase [Ktedonobacteraceae bacterium]|jgi:glucose-6-phosphate isomerase
MHLWNRYREYRYDAPEVGMSLDISRVRFEDEYLPLMASPMAAALAAMQALEAGAIANEDEQRMVGHYWLRHPDLAPTAGLGTAIRDARTSIHAFAEQVHRAQIVGAHGPFEHVIHVGIGGSALGPQCLTRTLRSGTDRLAVSFLDNADPEGIDMLLERREAALGRTLISVVSKSGWTPTPQHVMLELRAAYARRGLDFARHAVATTMQDSELDRLAVSERWLARFPLWEWVGGRTSVTSAVGLLPAALQGIDIDAFLEGAAAMDRLTRQSVVRSNPAALLALMWYWLGNGRGEKAMVVLPYKDRLAIFPRYIQQLVMESIGKKLNRAGMIVRQGLTVYGNKGSTDQHAYMQQLRDGSADFFVLFILVHKDRPGPAQQIATDLTLGDYLFASLEGTRNALYANGRDSLTLTLSDLTPASLGALIALCERAVGLYAELLNINAYHQPGVDKKAADGVSELQQTVVASLQSAPAPLTAAEIAQGIGQSEQVETIYKLLEHLAKEPGRGIVALPGSQPYSERFASRSPAPGDTHL